MIGFCYFLIVTGALFLVAGWISIATKGEVNYTASTLGMLLVIAGSVMMIRDIVKRR